MHIAIDVHSLGTQAAGNETYFQQLLRGLVLNRSHHQYSLFYVHAAALQSKVDHRFRWVAIPKNPLARIGIVLPWKLRKSAPDVFHCQYIQPPFTRAKTVVTIHDLAHEHHPAFAHPIETLALRKLVRATAHRADCILTVSQFCARDIVKTYGVPPGKVAVAYQAVSERFQPRDKALAQEQLARKYGIDPPFLLYVGRLQVRKNLSRLVEAYARLLQQGSAPKLVMVGKPDWGFDRLRVQIDRLHLQSHIVFPGYVAADDLPLFYNAAELFVFPSLFEGFGLPVLEGMASGVPTLTSRGSSLEEVAADGALLFDPYQPDSIAEAMMRVLGDEDLGRDLIARGLRRSKEFSVEKFAAQVLQVYSSLA